MKINKTKNAVNNIIFGALNKVVAIIFPFVIRTIILRMLGTEYLGLSGLFTAILNVLNLVELGIGTAIVFSMYKPIANDDEKTINALLNLYRKIYRIIGIGVLIIGSALLPFLKVFIKSGVPNDINIYILYAISLINVVIGYFFFAYKNSLLSAHQRTDVISNINTLVVLVMYVLQIVVLMVFKNYYVYAIFAPLSTLAINLYTAFITKKMFPNYKCEGKLDRGTISEIRKQMVGLFSAKVCNVVQASVDSVCISSFCGLSVLGVFNNYMYVITSIQSLILVVYQSVLAGVGNSVQTENLEYNKKLFNTLLLVFAWMIGFCSVCFMCLFQPFMTVWAGANNLMQITMVICMVVLFYVSQMHNVVTLYKEALGLWWTDKFRPVVMSLVNVVGTVLALKFWRIEGAILATIIANVFVSIPWATQVLFKNYFIKGQGRYYLKQLLYLVISGIAVVATYYLCSLINLSGIVKIVVNLIVCLIVPNVIYFVCYSKTNEFSHCKQIITRVIKKKLKTNNSNK